MWQSRKPEKIDELKEEMAQDIGKAIEWTRKWRVNISIEKTEVCMFTKKKISKEDKTIQLNGKELNYNPNPKLLGVILDEKMTFGKHLETLEKRASRNLTILREVRQISKMNTKKLLQLYFCLIRSVVEYSCPAWQVAEQKDLQKLDRLQRKALTLCLDMPSTSGRAALEIEAGVLPIDLRIEEIAIREIAKIQSKSIKEPIKQQLINYQEEIGHDIHITPMGKALCQSFEMEKETDININLIEPEFTYRLGETSRTKTTPSYWNRLGSSKSRTSEQKKLCITVMTELIGNTANDQATAYTDGSCMGNPGPCGAGAIIYTEDSRPAIRLHRPVAQRGSILLAELVAIVMVLEFCILERLHNTITTLKIFSDSQSAVGLLTLNWAPKSYIDVIRDIKEHIEDLRTKGMEICILWTPGHANIQGNDEADLLAKQAAEEATQLLPKNNIITLQDVKQGAHKSVMQKWQRRWELSDTGRDLFDITPNVKNIPIFDFPSKEIFSILIQLRTGYTTLNYYKQRTGQDTTDLCSCGIKETQQHYLTECPNYESYREEMYQQITKEIGIRKINTCTLLGRLDHENTEEYKRKLEIISAFISKTGRFDLPEHPQPQS
ncbi:unnamed protein product [Mytilus edulis]|uniref:ribonuclease H n=1 Tax=Mytilus edulis TaxID=6550 RepID=A0A8S3S2L8_MYTED|nr:unnamed protein product [Mytilus edulis]